MIRPSGEVAMKALSFMILTFLVVSCATKPGEGFLDTMMGSSNNHHTGQSAIQAGNAAMDAGNAASMHQMHHTPPPAGF